MKIISAEIGYAIKGLSLLTNDLDFILIAVEFHQQMLGLTWKFGAISMSSLKLDICKTELVLKQS